MWLALVKKTLSLQEKDLDTLFWDLDLNNTWGDYDLKIELLSRIKDEKTFIWVMQRLQESILDSIVQKKIIDEALKLWYKNEHIDYYIESLEESLKHYKEDMHDIDNNIDDPINRTVADIISMAEASSWEHLDNNIWAIDKFVNEKISNDN